MDKCRDLEVRDKTAKIKEHEIAVFGGVLIIK